MVITCYLRLSTLFLQLYFNDNNNDNNINININIMFIIIILCIVIRYTTRIYICIYITIQIYQNDVIRYVIIITDKKQLITYDTIMSRVLMYNSLNSFFAYV